MDDDADRERLDRIKAQQRAQSRREAALTALASQQGQSFDGKVSAVRTLHQADSKRVVSAISRLMQQDDDDVR